MKIKVAARSSLLSRAQVAEIQQALPFFLDPVWVTTRGDIDLDTPLSSLGSCDFFTKEIDDLVLAGNVMAGIHSAKDLADPLPKGLELIALSESIDPFDVLVLRKGETLASLRHHALIGTSSHRRSCSLKEIRSDLHSVDIRGTIERRLQLVDEGQIDGVIMAKAALLRLGIQRSFISFSHTPHPLQGRLAVVIREGDAQGKDLFARLDTRK